MWEHISDVCARMCSWVKEGVRLCECTLVFLRVRTVILGVTPSQIWWLWSPHEFQCSPQRGGILSLIYVYLYIHTYISYFTQKDFRAARESWGDPHIQVRASVWWRLLDLTRDTLMLENRDSVVTCKANWRGAPAGQRWGEVSDGRNPCVRWWDRCAWLFALASVLWESTQ